MELLSTNVMMSAPGLGLPLQSFVPQVSSTRPGPACWDIDLSDGLVLLQVTPMDFPMLLTDDVYL